MVRLNPPRLGEYDPLVSNPKIAREIIAATEAALREEPLQSELSATAGRLRAKMYFLQSPDDEYDSLLLPMVTNDTAAPVSSVLPAAATAGGDVDERAAAVAAAAGPAEGAVSELLAPPQLSLTPPPPPPPPSASSIAGPSVSPILRSQTAALTAGESFDSFEGDDTTTSGVGSSSVVTGAATSSASNGIVEGGEGSITSASAVAGVGAAIGDGSAGAVSQYSISSRAQRVVRLSTQPGGSSSSSSSGGGVAAARFFIREQRVTAKAVLPRARVRRFAVRASLLKVFRHGGGGGGGGGSGGGEQSQEQQQQPGSSGGGGSSSLPPLDRDLGGFGSYSSEAVAGVVEFRFPPFAGMSSSASGGGGSGSGSAPPPRVTLLVALTVSLVETSVGDTRTAHPISGAPCVVAFEFR